MLHLILPYPWVCGFVDKSRTLASSAGNKEYMYDGKPGLSWSIPWLAGMYALCCQVKPSITPDEFIDKALATGDTITVDENGKSYQLSAVINL